MGLLYAGDFLCVFVLLVVWVKCPAEDAANSCVIPDFVSRCRNSQ